MIKIAPSVLAADNLRLGQEARDVLEKGADALHLDMMDGHFVPNLSYGPELVRQLRQALPQAFLDVHLMLTDPFSYLPVFLHAGASAVTVHVEAQRPAECLREIRKAGALAGLSLKPATPAQALVPFFDDTDFLLVMTVEPGFGGQKLREDCVEKVRTLRRLGYQKPISVDGGVTLENAGMLKQAGVSILVMGTTVFHAQDRAEAIRKARQA